MFNSKVILNGNETEITGDDVINLGKIDKEHSQDIEFLDNKVVEILPGEYDIWDDEKFDSIEFEQIDKISSYKDFYILLKYGDGLNATEIEFKIDIDLNGKTVSSVSQYTGKIIGNSHKIYNGEFTEAGIFSKVSEISDLKISNLKFKALVDGDSDIKLNNIVIDKFSVFNSLVINTGKVVILENIENCGSRNLGLVSGNPGAVRLNLIKDYSESDGVVFINRTQTGTYMDIAYFISAKHGEYLFKNSLISIYGLINESAKISKTPINMAICLLDLKEIGNDYKYSDDNLAPDNTRFLMQKKLMPVNSLDYAPDFVFEIDEKFYLKNKFYIDGYFRSSILDIVNEKIEADNLVDDIGMLTLEKQYFTLSQDRKSVEFSKDFKKISNEVLLGTYEEDSNDLSKIWKNKF